MTTCILHNFIKKDTGEIHSSNRNEISESTLSTNLHSLTKQGGCAQKQSFENRDKFKDFFNSSAGKLPWT